MAVMKRRRARTEARVALLGTRRFRRMPHPCKYATNCVAPAADGPICSPCAVRSTTAVYGPCFSGVSVVQLVCAAALERRLALSCSALGCVRTCPTLVPTQRNPMRGLRKVGFDRARRSRDTFVAGVGEVGSDVRS